MVLSSFSEQWRGTNRVAVESIALLLWLSFTGGFKCDATYEFPRHMSTGPDPLRLRPTVPWSWSRYAGPASNRCTPLRFVCLHSTGTSVTAPLTPVVGRACGIYRI